jgi:hypothetical protein
MSRAAVPVRASPCAITRWSVGEILEITLLSPPATSRMRILLEKLPNFGWCERRRLSMRDSMTIGTNWN